MHHLNSYFILEQFEHGREYGRIHAVTLFLDISGFTHITETLMAHEAVGAEALANIITDIFEPLVAGIYGYGGDITNFAGDAFQAIFPFDETSKDAVLQKALDAAAFIREQMERNSLFQTEFGEFEFVAKTGLSIGEIEWGIIPGLQRHIYYFRGEAIDECNTAENLGKGGEIILHCGLYDTVRQWVAAVPVTENNAYLRITAFNWQHTPPQEIIPLPAPSRHTHQFSPQNLIDSEIQAEFRYTCNLFLNVTDITTHEELVRFMRIFFTAVEPYGGYFNRIAFGDKGCHLLLFWGAPTTYENDIQRALNFALQLSETTPVPIRFGITFGFSHAGFIGSPMREEYTCYGHRVNMAARLMGKAPWHSIWLDEIIYQQAQHEFILTHLDNIPLKGVSGYQPIYALHGQQKEMQQAAHYTTKLLGRQREMAQLHSKINPLFQQEFAGIITIYGEAGIGKSRLVYNLRQQLNHQAQSEASKCIFWIFCPVDEILRQPLNPFKYWLRQYFQQSRAHKETENKRLFAEKLQSLAAQLDDEKIVNELERTSSILGALIDLYWPDSLYEQLEPRLRAENTRLALINLIKAETTLQPVLLEIEDGHWLDSESKEMIGFLTRNLAEQPLAIVLTNRYQDDGTGFELPLETAVPQHEIHLTYLDQTAVAELAEQTVNGRVSHHIIHFLMEKTNGNPFFVEQLLLDLKERNHLQRDNSQSLYNFRASFQPQDVPANLRTVLISRLDRLMQETRNVVQMAAVLGQEFDVGVLKTMAVETDDLVEIISEIESEQIWEAISKLIYAFKHALMRDAAYSMQIQARLQQLHALAALAYESVYPDKLNDHYPSLAYHFEQAGIVGRATFYLKLAGDAAKNSYQNEVALDFYNRLLKYPLDDETRIETLLAQSDIYRLQGQWHPAIPQLHQGIELAQKINAHQKEIELRIQLATISCEMGEFNQAIQFLDRAVLLAERMDNEEQLANILIVMSRTYLYKGDFDKALMDGERAYQLHQEINNQKGIAAASSIMAGNYGMRNRFKEALEYSKKAILIFELLKEQVEIVRPIHNAGLALYFLGDFARAASYFERAAVQSENIGDRLTQLSAYHRLGQLYHANDKIDQAIFYFEKSVAISRELGDSGLPNTPTPYLAWACFNGKQYVQALAMALQHFENVQAQKRDVEHGMAQMVVGLILTKIDVQEASEEIIDLFTKISHITQLPPTPHAYFQFAIDAAREKNYLDTLIPTLTYYGSFLFKSNSEEGLKLLVEAKKLTQFYGAQWVKKVIAAYCAKLSISYDDL